ncbi:Polar amino acid transport system substrate-binding protein OS=Castellaniella defragrans OX=75697 GN=HNR28_000821 PE=4 SV=1 [Castellaniella defragrans]
MTAVQVRSGERSLGAARCEAVRRACRRAFSMLAATAVAAPESLQGRLDAGESVRVGFAEQVPFVVMGPNGSLTGYEVDLLKTVLQGMGEKSIKVQAVPTEFGALIPGLMAGRFDVIASDLYIRPDRCKLVAFAEPTHIVNDAVVVPAGNPKNIHSYADIARDSSFKLGYLSGGGPIADHALAAGVKKSQLVTLPDVASLFAAVKTHRIDGFLNTAITHRAMLKESKDSSLEIAEPFQQAVIDGKPAIGVGSFAFRPADKPFVQKFDKTLLTVLKSDAWVQAAAKYGFAKSDIPQGEVTTESLCKG